MTVQNNIKHGLRSIIRPSAQHATQLDMHTNGNTTTYQNTTQLVNNTLITVAKTIATTG